MFMKRNLPLIKYCALVLCAAGLASVFVTLSSVGALSNVGPDQNASGGYGGSSPRYVLEDTSYNTITSITVPVYLPEQPTGNVRIYVGDFKRPGGDSSTNMRVRLNGSSIIGLGGGSFLVSPGSFSQDASTGYYKTNITASSVDGWYSSNNIIQFTLRSDISGAYIGISGGSRYSTLSNYYYTSNNNIVFNYDIPFATPCSISSSQNRYIELRDLDSGILDGNRGWTVSVSVYDETAGASVTPTATTGSMGDNGTYRFYMNFSPGHKYRLHVNNVHANNSLDYIFPYDNINYAVSCGWSLSSQTQVNSAYDNNSPGSTIGFRHQLRNTGPSSTNRDVSYATRIVRVSGASDPSGDINRVLTAYDASTDNRLRSGSYSAISSGVAANTNLRSWADFNSDTQTRYTITTADVNHWICSYITYNPATQAGGGTWTRSSPVCRFVPYNYNLVPQINLTPGTAVEPGTTIDVPSGVTNNPGTTSSQDVAWELTEVIVNPGGTVPNEGGGTNSAAPCGTYFRPTTGTGSCETIGSGTDVFEVGNNPLDTILGRVIGDVAVGTKICWGLSVQPYSQSSGSDWRHSPLVCLVVGKKPKVQIHGGNLAAEDVRTSTTVKQSATGTDPVIFGSWSEYGILAPGTVVGMASAAGLSGGNSLLTQRDWSRLTFSNTHEGASVFGSYTAASTTQSVVDVLASEAGAVVPEFEAYPDIGGLLSSGTYTFSGSSIDLMGTSIPHGRSIVLNATGKTVNITGNITYTGGPLTSFSQIPQLIIIAQDINIDQSVTNVDAWLIASDTLVTCSYDNAMASNLKSAGATLTDNLRLTAATCDQQLTVNGFVSTSKLWLRRTAGSGTGAQSGDPAEVFNLRADAYLWAQNLTGANITYRTTYVKEAPPRF